MHRLSIVLCHISSRNLPRFLKLLSLPCLLVTLLAALLLQTGGAQAAGLQCNWNITKSKNRSPYANALNGVAPVSSSNAWAVGSYDSKPLGPGRTRIEQWNGRQWTSIPSPNIGLYSNSLNGVVALAAIDTWAAGYYTKSNGITQTLVEHWNGSNWSVVPSPNPGSRSNVLNGVTAVSGRDLWAVGTLSNGTHDNEALTERWDGRQWSVIPNPNLGTFAIMYGVTAVSASNVWSVGTYYNTMDGSQEALIEQWDGTQWSLVNSPLPEFNGVFLVSVAQTPGTAQLWAVGNYYDVGGVDRTLAEDYC